MRKIPLRVGVSWGARKALANIGAARSGLINVLVTDENTADEMATIINKGTNAKPGETTSL
jgi:DNA-binding transcriptional regulator LsrR (DeoR family)